MNALANQQPSAPPPPLPPSAGGPPVSPAPIGQPASAAPPLAPIRRTAASSPAKARQRKQARRWLPYIGAIALALALAAGLWPEPVPVETAQVTIGPLRASIHEEGKTRIKQRFTISAPVAGQLERIPYKAGAPVVAGETVLARIHPAPPAMLDARARLLAEARRDSAAASLERAEAGRLFASNELRRIQQLARQNTVSVQDLETAQWRETAAAKDLEAARGALRQAEAELAEFNAVQTRASGDSTAVIEVKAPGSGQVLRVLEESSRVVSPGMPLVEIGDPRDLEAVIEVLSRDGAALKPGTKVELDEWGGPTPLQAEVRLVEPSAFTKYSALGVEEQRVNAVVDLLTPPSQRGNLGDGFRVKARIITWENPNALKVPAGALFRHGQNWSLFLLRDGRAHLQTVSIGQTSGTETEILQGAQEGDAVIVYPGDRVRNNLRVRPITVSAAR